MRPNPMSMIVYEMEDPKDRRKLLDFVGGETITQLAHHIKSHFALHLNHQTVRPISHSWKQAVLRVDRLDKLPDFISAVYFDITTRQVEQFLRLPIYPTAEGVLLENNGMSFRLQLPYVFPRSAYELQLDWVAWK